MPQFDNRSRSAGVPGIDGLINVNTKCHSPKRIDDLIEERRGATGPRC
jgi:hypothetical protein